MECTLAAPHQAIPQASLCLPPVRSRSVVSAGSTLSTPSISGRTPAGWPTSICTAFHWEDAYRLALRSTARTGGLPQVGAQLLADKLWRDLDRLSSSAWQANARSERKLREQLIRTNARWLPLAVTTGWLLLPGAALGEEVLSEAASAVEQAVQSAGGAGTVDQGGAGSALVVLDNALEAGTDQASAAGPAEVANWYDSLGSGAVSVLFVLAFLGLVALTIGVSYLAISEFREKREAEKEKLSRAPAKPVEEPDSVILRGKGFGKKVEKVAKEKSRSK